MSCLGARTVRLPLTVVKKFAFAALRATHVTLSRFTSPTMAVVANPAPDPPWVRRFASRFARR